MRILATHRMAIAAVLFLDVGIAGSAHALEGITLVGIPQQQSAANDSLVPAVESGHNNDAAGTDSTKKQSLYFPESMLKEIQEEATAIFSRYLSGLF